MGGGSRNGSASGGEPSSPEPSGGSAGDESAPLEGPLWLRLLGFGLIAGGLLLLGVATAVAASFRSRVASESGVPSAGTAMLYGGHSYLCLEVASTPEERARGLSGRDEIGLYDGMAFLFPGEAPTRAPFWMKDTRFPLDLVFVAPDERVAEVLRMEPCDGDDCPEYSPTAPYLYAVELPAGYAEEFGIAPGIRVRLGGACAPIDRD